MIEGFGIIRIYDSGCRC